MTTRPTVTYTDGDHLRLLIHGNTAFALLTSGLDSGLFEFLDSHPDADVGQVAEKLGIERQPARILLLGLTSLRLLRCSDGRYRNTDVVRRKLLRAGPRFLGPLIDVQRHIINRAIGDLPEAISANTNVGLRRLDGPGDTLYERLSAHPQLQEVFYANMGDASRRSVPQFLDRYDFSLARHVVDLGGGDGSNAIALAERYPDLRITIVDSPGAVQHAEARLNTADLRRRITVLAGDMHNDPLPSDADAILVFHIFEIWSLARNTALLRRCHEALSGGGVCLIYNFVSRDDGTGPLTAGLLSPYFLALASGEGMVYSPADMQRALTDAGFSRTERVDDLPFHHALVVGHR